jgi:AbrB family looped-hinge helix DNA binding protein
MVRRKDFDTSLSTRSALCQSSVTSKGQATIPAVIRRELHIEPGDKVSFAIEGGRAVMDKVQIADHVWNDSQSAMLSEWNDPEQDVYND